MWLLHKKPLQRNTFCVPFQLAECSLCLDKKIKPELVWFLLTAQMAGSTSSSALCYDSTKEMH